MIAFTIYALVFLYLSRNIWPSDTGGLNRNVWPLVFLLKILAIPAFYFIYQKLYGGVNDFDAGKFIQDSRVINDYARQDLAGYLRILFGFQDDRPGSAEFEECLKYTFNWDNGTTPDLFYNDNRIIIRLHALLEFIAFDSFFVHALFSCTLSFAGGVLLYRTFLYYIRPSLWLVAALFFLPALWFYTGAPLKEGLCVFVTGCSMHLLQKFSGRDISIIQMFILAALLFISCFLKPYLLLPVTLSFILFLQLQRMRLRRKIPAFLLVVTVVVVLMNFLFSQFYRADLMQSAQGHQRQFLSVASGGYFLRDTHTFIRVPDDRSLITETADPAHYKINKNTPYTYWELDHVQDTLYCEANKDTSRIYELVYHIPHSGSNIRHGVIGNTRVPLLLSALYYALVHPHFFSAAGSLQLAAAAENFILLLALLFTITGFIRGQKPALLPFVLIFTAISTAMLIAIAAPNSGAILRYRAPVIIFILVAAVYYLPVKRKAEIQTMDL